MAEYREEMQSEPVNVRVGTGDDLTGVQPLWLSLYDHQTANGMLVKLSADAFQQWSDSIGPMLGRFTCLFVAEEEGHFKGFLAGRIRSLPQYFGGNQVGFISEVFVHDSCRSKGIGRRLVTEAVSWFREQGISRLELQVITGNEGARRLYRELGWVEELVQMVLLPSPHETRE